MKDNKIRCTCHLNPHILSILDRMQRANTSINSRNAAIERAVEFYKNAIYAAGVKLAAKEKASKSNKAMLDDINQWFNED